MFLDLKCPKLRKFFTSKHNFLNIKTLLNHIVARHTAQETTQADLSHESVSSLCPDGTLNLEELAFLNLSPKGQLCNPHNFIKLISNGPELPFNHESTLTCPAGHSRPTVMYVVPPHGSPALLLLACNPLSTHQESTLILASCKLGEQSNVYLSLNSNLCIRKS